MAINSWQRGCSALARHLLIASCKSTVRGLDQIKLRNQQERNRRTAQWKCSDLANVKTIESFDPIVICENEHCGMSSSQIENGRPEVGAAIAWFCFEIYTSAAIALLAVNEAGESCEDTS